MQLPVIPFTNMGPHTHDAVNIYNSLKAEQRALHNEAYDFSPAMQIVTVYEGLMRKECDKRPGIHRPRNI